MNLNHLKELVAWFEAQGIDNKAVSFELLPGTITPRAVARLPPEHPFWGTVSVPRTHAGLFWRGTVAGVTVMAERAAYEGIPVYESDYLSPDHIALVKS